MAFNINRFTAAMNGTGMARADFFEVRFTGLPLGLGIRDTQNLSLRAEQVTVPQRAVTPIEYRDYGVPYKIGGIPNYIEIDMTFILSDDLQEREFFMAWQDLITGQHRRKNGISRGKEFDIGYFDDYKCSGIEILHYTGSEFDEDDEDGLIPSHSIKLIDAYPLNVATLSRAWAQPEILKQQVTFTYRYFTEETLTSLPFKDPDIDITDIRNEARIRQEGEFDFFDD